MARPPGGTTNTRLAAVAIALAILVALGLGVSPTVAGNATAPALASGGTLKFNLSNTDIDFSDPSLAYGKFSWQLEYATALQLYNYPDEPAPQGGILQPEAATSLPTVSADGKTYTITVEPGFKFSDGTDVTADNFAFAVNRALSPIMASPGAAFIKDIVGAQDVLDGKAATASGVHVDGDTLIIELTQPDGTLPAKLAMPFFQALETNMPTDPNGVNVYPSAGPYYWASRDATQITIRRNPFYTGSRPAKADEFDIAVRTNIDQSLLQVKAGDADFDLAGPPPTAHADLGATYGVNVPGGQYHVTPMNEADYVALNTSRAPFSNVSLRQAVNYAVDRPAMTLLRGAYAATPADQTLPSGMAGFSDAGIYPLEGPDLDTAKALAGTACGTVKLWGVSTGIGPSLADSFKSSLEQIGCTVQVTLFTTAQLFAAAGHKGADFDAVLVNWSPDYPDPYAILDVLLNGNNIQADNNTNLAYFDDAEINAELAQANALVGDARYAAYGDLDVAITTDHAPWVVYDNRNAREFTAPRLRGYVFQPAVGSADLTTFAVNTPPVANDLSVTVGKDRSKEITLQATDADGDNLTYSIVAGPAHGSLGQIDGDLVTYTPSPGYTGPDSFTYKANDGQDDSNVATVSITVSAPSLSVTDLQHGRTAAELASSLVGGGVTISNVSYTGAGNAAGSFSGGSQPIGFAQGIVLGSGSVQTTVDHKGVEGPNEDDGVTTVNNTPGDADLTALAGANTFDASVLEFDFVPQFSTVQFRYVFSSDEYNEFANSAFNDTFAFLVNGQNCALVPGTTGTPVGVNTINGGNPFGTNAQHPELFRNNDLSDGGGSIDTEMDGLTVVLTCTASVTPNATNHLKLAIADAGDSSLDSNVFIEAGSLVSGTQVATSLTGGGQTGTAITVPSGTAVHDSATLSGQNVASAGGSVTYKVYSDSNCQTLFADAGTKSVAGGSVPDSNPVTLGQAGTFYWQASYSGDALNQPGVSACGGETVVVTGNHAPVAQDVSVTTAEETPVNVNMSASDADGDPLTYTIVAGPTDGTLGSVSGNQVTYTPDAGFNGSDSFTYKANDGQLDSNVATASITVTPAGQPTLTVEVFGSGTVTSSPPGINCPPQCSAALNPGTQVTLTAHPDSGQSFVSWSGCDQASGLSCTVQVSFDRTVRAVFTSPACLTYPDFSSAPKLAVLGDAAIVGNVLRLTPATFNQSGVAWHGAKVDVADGFVSDFDFRMSNMGGIGDADGPGADGFTFAIQNTAVAATGSIGGGLGYDGLLNSLVVEFDTYDNGLGSGDPNGNHVAVHTRGTGANGPGDDSLLGVTALDPAILKLNDGNVHRGRVSYDPSRGGELRVYVDDLATPVLTVAVSLSSTLSLDAGTAWVGFTAATGAGVENHDILDWFHCSGTQLPPALSLAPQAAVENVGAQHAMTATFTDNGSPIADAAVNFTVVSGPNAGTTGIATTQPNGEAAFSYASATTGTDEVRATVVRNGQTFVSNTATVDWQSLRTVGVHFAGTGGGTVSITPDGSDAIVCSSDCFHAFADGTHVTLTAAADDGSQFSGWSGACASTDPCALTLTADVSVTADFQHVNRAPVAVGSTVATDQDTPAGITLQASDPDGDPLTYTIVTGPAHGSLSGSGATRTYTPAAGYSGPDSFSFKASDGTLDSNTATVTITVRHVNHAPLAADGTAATDQDTAANVTLQASDPDGDPLAYTILSAPAHGSLSGTGATRTYTPSAGYSGPDSFSFKASDGTLDSNTATVSITVRHVNHAPLASDGTAATDQDTAAPITLQASDPDGDPLAYTIVSAPAHGSLSGSGAARTYTPTAGYSGPDSFTFKANDGSLDSNTATVSITVRHVNHAPIAGDGTAATDQDTPAGITLQASDPDGDPLSYTIVTGPAHGSLNGSGATRTYSPAAGYSGPDSFTFKANDGSLDSNTATVSITVRHVNHAPIAGDGTAATDQDTPAGITLQASDPDGDPLSYTIVTGPAHGSLSGSGATRTYTPTAGYSGPDSFTFKANDGSLDSNTATVSITVRHVNHAPVAQNSAATTQESTAASVTLGATDPDGDPLTYTIVSGPAHGAVSGTGATRTYIPTAGYSGPDSFTFKASDGSLDSNTATVSITVTATPFKPPSTGQPVPQKTEVVTVVRGKVLIQRKRGGPFVPLTGTDTVPFGLVIDTTNGTLRLKVASDRKGGTSTLDVTGGQFYAQQDKTLLTTLVLTGGDFTVCSKRKLAQSGPPKTGGTSVRHLWGSGKGRFRTKGRYSSATVRGTNWLTDDRCGGTLTYVKKGTVTVIDFVLHKTVIVPKGQSYLAKP